MPGAPPRALYSPFRGGTAATRLQCHRVCAQGERSPAREPPPPSTPSHTPRHPGVFARCCPSSGQTSSTRTLATSRPLGTPGPSFAPPSLVFSVRKGYIGAVTERLRVGAACGHHISAGNGGGRETSVDLLAPVSESLPDGTPD